MNDELDVLSDVVDRLDKAAIAYMITGSIAMAFYAIPRMTRDIDIVITLSQTDASDIYTAFKDDYYIDEEAVRQSIRSHGMFNIINQQTVIKIDLIIRKNEEYRIVEFTRRKQIAIKEKQVWFVAPEDLILSKLVWAKESESELQLRDVKQLVQSVKDLDGDYLRDWAAKLGVAYLLERTLHHA